MRPVLEAPESVVTDGRCNWGTYNRSIDRINPLEAYRPLGFPLPTFLLNRRLKEWEALQLVNDDWFICLAVYDTKSIGTAIVMMFNRQEETLYLYRKKVPSHLLQIASGLEDSSTLYRSREIEIEIRNRLSAGEISVSFNCAGSRGRPPVKAHLTANHDTEPLVIVQPFGTNRPLYSHKALMSCRGSVEMKGSPLSEFTSDRGVMIMDDHKGFYPLSMRYDWCTACGYDGKGRPMGFNLTDNQVLDHEKYNENCLWINGKMVPLPPVSFERPGGLNAPWIIRDGEGTVDLRFHPRADAPEKLNFGLIRVDYHGVFGEMEGTISGPSGKVSFDRFPAMGEKKFIRM